MPEIPKNEPANISLQEPVPEPQFEVIQEDPEEEKEYTLKATATCDLARYDQELVQKHIFFKPTYTGDLFTYVLRPLYLPPSTFLGRFPLHPQV